MAEYIEDSEGIVHVPQEEWERLREERDQEREVSLRRLEAIRTEGRTNKRLREKLDRIEAMLSQPGTTYGDIQDVIRSNPERGKVRSHTVETWQRPDPERGE